LLAAIGLNQIKLHASIESDTEDTEKFARYINNNSIMMMREKRVQDLVINSFSKMRFNFNLSVIIDKNLSFAAHVDYLGKKIGSKLGCLVELERI